MEIKLAAVIMAALLIATDTEARDWRDFEPILKQQREWIRQSHGATIIPQYGGGYVIKEFDGTTNVSKPDAFGRVHIRRSGYLNRWDW